MAAKILLHKLTDRSNGQTFTPPIPVDVTRFYNVDETSGSVEYRDLTFAEVSTVWHGLPPELAIVPADRLAWAVQLTDGGR